MTDIQPVRLKVYLAGKIRKNDWRHDAVTGLRGAWPLEVPADSRDLSAWPVLPGAVLGRADYMGPYFVGCDHGCTHGEGTHAMEGGCTTFTDRRLLRMTTVERCKIAISQSGLVAAWIDSTDCFGTLVEIGIAATMRKRVAIGFDDALGDAIDDLWFAAHLAYLSAADGYLDTPIQARYSSPRQFLETVIPAPKAAVRLDSEAERLFWDAYERSRPPALTGLVTQHRVMRYRLDFALPAQRVGIEVDGYAFHSDKETFTRDRARQREIELAGWRIVRFSGKEVCDDPDACVQAAARAAEAFAIQDRPGA